MDWMLKLPKELANQFDDESQRIWGEQESGVHESYWKKRYW